MHPSRTRFATGAVIPFPGARAAQAAAFDAAPLAVRFPYLAADWIIGQLSQAVAGGAIAIGASALAGLVILRDALPLLVEALS